ncbi:IS66 family insertion sequence element accessory protein TnpA [Dokdonella fugitiva]|uniref:Transposase n=1 Tax=Dokdonella fugitiva TaxID=328517 RepID=A0A4R2HZF8_9GAMM|nr:hypothetical protein [Dokdonella fugitiva]MBA8885605.1 hypothetical protein [Dokdonella fugitiva]TCO36827.1 hypothetical protein EV148_1113 [Dokdonella fugitiva]
MQGKATVWSKRIVAWRSSGESAAAYCRARGLSYSQFVYWQRRSSALVPVAIETRPAAQAESVAGVEVVLPSGLRLRVPALPMAELAALVRALC